MQSCFLYPDAWLVNRDKKVATPADYTSIVMPYFNPVSGARILIGVNQAKKMQEIVSHLLFSVKPTNGAFTLHYTTKEMGIPDKFEKLVILEKKNNNSIDFSNIKPDVYFISIIFDAGSR